MGQTEPRIMEALFSIPSPLCLPQSFSCSESRCCHPSSSLLSWMSQLSVHVSHALCTPGSCGHFHHGDCLVIPCACSLWRRILFQNSHNLSQRERQLTSVAELHSGWLVRLCAILPGAPPQHLDHPQRSPTEWHEEATLHTEALRGKNL